jgi:hypothetical protein
MNPQIQIVFIQEEQMRRRAMRVCDKGTPLNISDVNPPLAVISVSKALLRLKQGCNTDHK